MLTFHWMLQVSKPFTLYTSNESEAVTLRRGQLHGAELLCIDSQQVHTYVAAPVRIRVGSAKTISQKDEMISALISQMISTFLGNIHWVRLLK